MAYPSGADRNLHELVSFKPVTQPNVAFTAAVQFLGEKWEQKACLVSDRKFVPRWNVVGQGDKIKKSAVSHNTF